MEAVKVCERIVKVPPFWKKVYLFTNGDTMYQKKGNLYFCIKRKDCSIYLVHIDYFNWQSVTVKFHYEKNK